MKIHCHSSEILSKLSGGLLGNQISSSPLSTIQRISSSAGKSLFACMAFTPPSVNEWFPSLQYVHEREFRIVRVVKVYCGRSVERTDLLSSEQQIKPR